MLLGAKLCECICLCVCVSRQVTRVLQKQREASSSYRDSEGVCNLGCYATALHARCVTLSKTSTLPRALSLLSAMQLLLRMWLTRNRCDNISVFLMVLDVLFKANGFLIGLEILIQGHKSAAIIVKANNIMHGLPSDKMILWGYV